MKNKDVSISILNDKHLIDQVVDTHMKAFPDFFLTFLGEKFLHTLYTGFLNHKESDLLVAKDLETGKIIGFLAYSKDLSGFYKWLLKHKIIQFGYYSFLAALKSPKSIFRLIRAFLYPSQAKKEENYIEISSIGVLPGKSNGGIGSKLLTSLPKLTDTKGYKYIELTTDAKDNDKANYFYQKNGFKLNKTFKTPEGRVMNEYYYLLD
ncbi:GNAT family N-acetyltransferase [Streptococcus uberis]|uniref:GNAT family N-acetyltransferase n=1 Tax=Streptococcus uberis TaxID=1349 RepID=UPI000DF87FD6|nr:GNAT family N-acetyltransferase [Streptococcus uberis]MCK1215800.1 GNAT family N-acetyltransferase [Streptococcus uberis]SUO91403.1 acetyltransferase (GNAT) family protein [Streptococcus uberis]